MPGTNYSSVWVNAESPWTNYFFYIKTIINIISRYGILFYYFLSLRIGVVTLIDILEVNNPFIINYWFTIIVKIGRNKILNFPLNSIEHKRIQKLTKIRTNNVAKLVNSLNHHKFFPFTWDNSVRTQSQNNFVLFSMVNLHAYGTH